MIILTILSFLVGSILPDYSIKKYSSKAIDLNTNNFIYSEIHEEKFEGSKISESVTKYVDASRNILSERIMKFDEDLTKPDFELKDLRSGYIEGAEILNGNNVRVYTRKDFNSALEEEILKVPEPFVIDGGLTYFFIQNWEDLMKGKTIEFNFITPSKLDFFKFRVYKNDIVEIGGRKGLRLKLEVNSFILRAFVDPIMITYDLQNKEILQYVGISNINNDEGKSYSVEINFTGDNKL